MPPSDVTAPAARRPRDPRIDTFRGLALVMIFVDHMPGNPYEQYTLRNWGFSDAAEAFFIMSGMAAGIAYSAGFQAVAAGTALWTAVAPLWRRAWTLYLAHIFLTLCGIAMFAAAYLVYADHEFVTVNNLELLYEDTAATVIGLPLLGYQIGYVDILPTYSVLLLFAPLAFLGARRWPGLVLAASGALWFAAGLWRWNIPNFPGDGGWFFSPLCWQFIFVIGMCTGIRLRQGRRLVPVRRDLFWLCVGFLVLALAWRTADGLGAVLNHRMSQLGALGAPHNLVSHVKAYLALPRLLHVLALVYVISCLPAVRTMSGHAWAMPLRLLGQHGLLVFCSGTLLALLGQILFRAYPERGELPWLLPVAGTMLLVAIAALADTASPKRREAPRELGRAAARPGGQPGA